MRRFLVDPRRPDVDIVRDAARTVVAGGVVAFPTETLYGLAVDPRNASAVNRLFEVKRRARDQPIALVAADISQVEQVGTMSDLARRLAKVFWPGPLTIVIEANSSIVAEIHRSTGHVGVRVPSSEVALMLARECGFALTATSANLSGEPPTNDPEEVSRSLDGRIDLLIDAGKTAGGLPSTVVDLTLDAPVLLRAGAVPFERVLECR